MGVLGEAVSEGRWQGMGTVTTFVLVIVTVENSSIVGFGADVMLGIWWMVVCAVDDTLLGCSPVGRPMVTVATTVDVEVILTVVVDVTSAVSTLTLVVVVVSKPLVSETSGVLGSG